MNSLLDFRLLFESSPNPYLVLLPDAPIFTIIAVNDSYLAATGTSRSEILECGLFEVFPDNPKDASATGVSDLRISLERVIREGVQDAMGVQKYDIPRLDGADGEFEVRYWSPVNTPVFAKDRSLSYIIHRVEDITEFILLQERSVQEASRIEGGSSVSQMEAEILRSALEVKDINRQLKATKEELSKSESRFRQIMDSNMIGIIFANLVGSITEANDAFLNMLGYAREDLISGKLSWKDITPEEYRHFDESVILELQSKGVITPYEKEFICKNGRRIYGLLGAAFLEGSQTEIVAFILDITSQKQAETMLKQLNEGLDKRVQERTKEILEVNESLRKSLKDLSDIKFALDVSTIVATTNPQGAITYVNDAFCKISKYSKGELIGQNPRIINSRHHPREFFKELWSTIGRGKVWNGEIRNKSKDGIFYWVNTTIVPFLDKDGKPYQYTAILHDITAQKNTEEEIRQFNAELEHQVGERTAQLRAINKELEAFSYSVSHDLRAPLRSIDGFSQILLKSYKEQLDETGQDYLQRVRASSQRMAQLIDDLLNLSRLSRSEMRIQSVNLSELVKNVVTELQEQEPERQIEFIIEEGVMVSGDSRLLFAVIQNLVANAWKYTSKHSTARIEFGTTHHNGQLTYFIKDDGAGFDMTYSDKLFGAFHRLHGVTEFPGIGIGLATVQRIIHRHGGEVWGEGEIEKGATFYFTLNSYHAINKSQKELANHG